MKKHLEGCTDCEHRNETHCEHAAVGEIALLPPAWYRRRGLDLVPRFCPLGPHPWPEDERSNG